MIRRMSVIFVFLVLSVVHVIALMKTTDAWNALPRDEDRGHLMPSSILKITSLEYDGLISDYLFMETMVFIGGNITKENTIKLTPAQWSRVYQQLDAASDLDPYFVDPYYVGNAYLTWDARQPENANKLLIKGIEARSWDWSIPFFVGFNYFYFLQDSLKASEYLEIAAKRPGASPILASLASKLAYKEHKIENSIIFLEEILKNTDDEQIKKQFELRIEALKTRQFLGKVVSEYRRRFGKRPQELNDLITGGLLTAIPREPYGGRYSLDINGNIVSTTDDLMLPHTKQ